LRELPMDSKLPWHRVVSAQGRLADFSNASKQRRLLENEGIIFSVNGRLSKSYYM
jgi:methylated-DNA-protein-cysteine methyltransferase-like protein